MSAPFVTKEMRRFAARVLCCGNHDGSCPVPADCCDCSEREADANDVLDAVAPLWLAHVQQASEHTADYQMAARAEAALKALAAERGLSEAEKRAQAARCGCRGTDIDWCICQNAPDSVTIKERVAAMKGTPP